MVQFDMLASSSRASSCFGFIVRKLLIDLGGETVLPSTVDVIARIWPSLLPGLRWS